MSEKPAHRPSDFKQETADKICERLANGNSLRSICKSADMPAMATVFVWLTKHIDFQEQYARARETQADTLVDEMLDIADDGENDWMLRRGIPTENGETINRSRLRIATRQWLAGKMRPKKYGGRPPKDEDDGEKNELVIRVEES